MTVASNPLTASAPAVDVDIAIVGDGLVGRPAAVALAAAGHTVALIDRRSIEQGSNATLDALDQRCTALSAGSVDWLRAQGLWRPQAAQASPIRQVHVSHRGRFGATRINAADVGRDAVGWTIENRCFADSLAEALEDKGVLRYGSRVVAAIDEAAAHVDISLLTADEGCSAERLRARLLVVADGVNSATARLLGIASTETAHQQWATLTTVRTDRDHQGVAHERFSAGGPLALLPRPDAVLSVVACHDEPEAQTVKQLDDSAFLHWLGERMQTRSGRPIAVGPRVQIPLARIEAEAQHHGRSVLIGNAARLLHPVAGQGYNLALRDVAALLAALAASGSDPGDPVLLGAWLAARRKDQTSTVTLTDTLARVFRGHASLPAHVRAGGLLALDLISPLRREFVRRTTRGPWL